MNIASQIWITAFGLTALLLMQSSRRGRRRWGPVLGLIGQPGWYIQLLIHEQYSLLPLYTAYTAIWVLGFCNLCLTPFIAGLGIPELDENDNGVGP